MPQAQAVFVDSGAWIAWAFVRDPLHAPARKERVRGCTSPFRCHRDLHVPRSQRQPRRGARLEGAIYAPGAVTFLACELRDLEHAWDYFRRADLHNNLHNNLWAVDATSFAIMKRACIRMAYTFDHSLLRSG